jgi:hypothetical protein
MQHPIYLEDYIVALCDLSDFATLGVDAETMIRLGKRDRLPVRNLANQVKHKRLGLTDAQVILVRLLVDKYRKQLAKWKIDAALAQSASLFLPMRIADRYRTLECKDNMLQLRFNFDKELIDTLHDLSVYRQGKFNWIKSEGYWAIYPSEGNVEQVVEFAIKHDFTIDPPVRELYDRVKKFKAEHGIQEFMPMLCEDRSVVNASPALTEFVENSGQNFYRLYADSWLNSYEICDHARQRMRDLLKQHHDHSILYKLLGSRYVECSSPNYLRIAETFCKITGYGPVILVLNNTDPGLKPQSNETMCDDPSRVYYFNNVENFDLKLTVMPNNNALVVTDTEMLNWFWFDQTLNKIWYIKDQDAGTNSN